MTWEDESPIVTLDLLELAHSGSPGRPVWSYGSDDLNVNLVVLRPEERVAEHTNTDVEVLVLGMDGDGTIEADRRTLVVSPGRIAIIPTGCTRAIQAGAAGFAYLTCHRRRHALWPVTRFASVRE